MKKKFYCLLCFGFLTLFSCNNNVAFNSVIDDVFYTYDTSYEIKANEYFNDRQNKETDIYGGENYSFVVFYRSPNLDVDKLILVYKDNLIEYDLNTEYTEQYTIFENIIWTIYEEETVELECYLVDNKGRKSDAFKFTVNLKLPKN